MKVYICIAFLVIALFNNSDKDVQDDPCNVFESDGATRDTIVLKATYTNLVTLPQGFSPLQYLQKRKIIRSLDHHSDILVKIAGCDFEYRFVCGDNSREGLKALNEKLMQKVILTCVVFRDNKIPLHHDKPFVLVTQVRKAE